MNWKPLDHFNNKHLINPANGENLELTDFNFFLLYYFCVLHDTGFDLANDGNLDVQTCFSALAFLCFTSY